MWCLISTLGCHGGRSCTVQFHSEPLGHRASPLCTRAPSHPWLSLAGIISDANTSGVRRLQPNLLPTMTPFTIHLGGLVCLWVVAKQWHLQVSPHCSPDGESSPPLAWDSSVPHPREESDLPEDSSIGTQSDVHQASEAVIHRQHFPSYHPFPAKEKGSRVCQGLWPLVSSLSIRHLPRIPGRSHIYPSRGASSGCDAS